MALETFTGPQGVASPYKGLRGGIYARKSNYAGKKKSLHRSVAEQLEASDLDAVRLGVVVDDGHRYVDDGISASRYARDERDEFERLLDDIENRRLDIVISWASNRLQRDLAIYVRLRDVCAAAGVLLCYGGRVYDMTSKDDRFRTGLDALVGERDVDELRDNVKRSLRSNAVQGRPHGPTPYGYSRVYDPRTGAFVEVVVNPNEGPVVLDVATRYANGDGPAKIVRHLTAEKIPPPGGRWTPHQVEVAALGPVGEHPMHAEIKAEAARRFAALSEMTETIKDIADDFNRRELPLVVAKWNEYTVKRFATDPRYLGARLSNGEVTKEDAWPEIVPPSIHAKCLAVTEKRARGGAGTRSTAAVHWLSGIGRCDDCDFHHYVGWRKQKPYYRCVEPGVGDEKGYHFSLEISLVDSFVEGQLFDWLSEPAWLRAYMASDKERARKHAEATGNLDILQRRLNGFYKSAAAGTISDGALAAIEAELLPQIKELEKTSVKLGVPPVVQDLPIGNRQDIAAAWKKLDIAQRRLIAETLLDVRMRSAGQGVKVTEANIDQYVTVTAAGMKLAA